MNSQSSARYSITRSLARSGEGRGRHPCHREERPAREDLDRHAQARERVADDAGRLAVTDVGADGVLELAVLVRALGEGGQT